MRACVVIPARYMSSRFQGKPLALLLGRPMIIWVAEISSQAVGIDNVFVATEDKRIAKVVQDAGFSVIMTSVNALTGTDRLAEASQFIDYDIYVNVQGDEPLVDPVDILKAIDTKKNNMKSIVNGYCFIGNDEDPSSINIPKVVTNEFNEMIYMSRSLIPGIKECKNNSIRYKKQVCIYAYTGDELLSFREFGRKSTIETFEDIEILRFLEIGCKVIMYECKTGSLAVDVPSDISKVESVMRLKYS